ncbi:MAG: rhodanese-like domain-containing protein [Nodularia sp. (in: Bacteria)]|nr:MAG: rhodanese-like domain-containing protein [Nodularia sp. (in: cyanobacteria)]
MRSSFALNFCKLLIRLKFPHIHQISTKDFAQWLLNSPKTQPLVIDARSQAEFEVSHLKAAVHIDPIAPDLQALSEVVKNTPIVVYCSIGYRSATIAQQLQQAGFTCVFNLSGGLFQWSNEGRLMFQNEKVTQCIHPYNAMWGKLLKDGKLTQSRRGAER